MFAHSLLSTRLCVQHRRNRGPKETEEVKDEWYQMLPLMENNLGKMLEGLWLLYCNFLEISILLSLYHLQSNEPT